MPETKTPKTHPDSTALAADRWHWPALDGLRGVAILLVMWAHFTPQWATTNTAGWTRLAHNLLNGGWAGVDLFFVLSGFLITGILIDAKKSFHNSSHAGSRGPGSGSTGPGVANKTGSETASKGDPGAARYFGNFYARRTLRIFPLYYGVLACVALWIFASGSAVDRQLWRQYAPWMWLYVSNIAVAQHGWLAPFHGLLLNHFWTLAVEEQFYLIWPLIVYLCAGRSLRTGCLAAIALAPLLRFFWTAVDHNTYAAFALMPCRIDSFAVEALVAMAVREVCVNPEDHRLRLARAGRILMIVGVSLIVPAFWNDALIDVLGRSVLALLSGGLILLSLYSSLGSWLDNPLLRFLGKYSYGLYILHFLIHPQLDRLLPVASFGVAIHFVGCVAVSCASPGAPGICWKNSFSKPSDGFRCRINETKRIREAGLPLPSRTSRPNH